MGYVYLNKKVVDASVIWVSNYKTIYKLVATVSNSYTHIIIKKKLVVIIILLSIITLLPLNITNANGYDADIFNKQIFFPTIYIYFFLLNFSRFFLICILFNES